MSGILGFSAALGKPPKPVSSPVNPRRDYSKAIPVDLWIQILSRLSVKDIALCRCVSRLWSSVLRGQDFSELFLTVSSTRPRLLFALLHKNEWIFYSAPQAYPELNSSPLVPSYHMRFPKGLGSSYYDEICAPVRGLVCCKTKNPMIFNPSTGEYLTLPGSTERLAYMETLLGYDPIDKLFKVFSVSEDSSCRVSTIGTIEANWRTIECSTPHKPVHAEISIGGVLYYLALRISCEDPEEPYVLVCFDVRSEKFNFIIVEFKFWCSVFVNCKGKLGVMWPGVLGLDESIKQFDLWILEDVDKVKWSKTFYTLPYNWKYIVEDIWLYIVGMNEAGEVVLSTAYLHHPFYIVYFNVEKNTLVRHEIQFEKIGEDARFSRAYTFLDHVENVKPIELIP